MKLTEESLNLVIDILNDLICEGKMLNDVERRSLLNAVMAITAVKERSVVSVSSRKEQSKKEKKEREIERMLDFSFFYLKLDYSFILLRHLRHRSRS